VLFAIAYVISQITIIVILGPIEAAMIKLQVTGVSADAYLAVFRDWEASGGMAFYRAHFILDDPHPIWYAGLFTTLLCRLFDRCSVAHKYDWVLLLPLGSGLLDWYETSPRSSTRCLSSARSPPTSNGFFLRSTFPSRLFC